MIGDKYCDRCAHADDEHSSDGKCFAYSHNMPLGGEKHCPCPGWLHTGEMEKTGVYTVEQAIGDAEEDLGAEPA